MKNSRNDKSAVPFAVRHSALSSLRYVTSFRGSLLPTVYCTPLDANFLALENRNEEFDKFEA
jgi:hypothetical protein